jgi:hypothetical protein
VRCGERFRSSAVLSGLRTKVNPTPFRHRKPSSVGKIYSDPGFLIRKVYSDPGFVQINVPEKYSDLIPGKSTLTPVFPTEEFTVSIE